MTSLGDFLRAEMGNGAPWNCSTLAADWCVTQGHPDFAAQWRAITDPGLCEATPAEAGGLVELWNQGIGDSLPDTTDLLPGDIAVITAHGFDAGAIFTGERWAIRAARGLHFIAADSVGVIRAWRP